MCGFCYHQIRSSINPKCPSCRAKYKSKQIEFTPPSEEEVAARIQAKRDNLKKSKKKVDRQTLSKMRVLQRNLVYVTNLPLEYAKEEILSRPEFFGQYGKIRKIAVNTKVNTATSNNSNAAQQQQQQHGNQNPRVPVRT